MERQSILERLGWRFIRIRGSEYYRDKETTMQRVVQELGELGIQPEQGNDEVPQLSFDHQLIDRVKLRAAQLLDEWHGRSVAFMQDAAEASAPEERIPDPRPVLEAFNSPVSVETPVQRRRRRQENSAAAEQQSMDEVREMRCEDEEEASPIDRFIAEVRALRFSCIDHRETAAIFWVIYDRDRQNEFEALAQKYLISCTLERRGARATQNRPAWRIMCR